MNFRMDQIDEMSVLATEYIAEEFKSMGMENPPDVTPGMVRNVVKAMLSISDKNGGLKRMKGEVRRCSECANPATIFFQNFALCPSCAARLYVCMVEELGLFGSVV